MTVRNHRIRLAANNFLKTLDSARVTYSSQLTTFPYSNSQLDLRSKVFKFGGRFTIDSTNKNLYINDGSPITISLDENDYTTPDLLAAEIQSKLNASSSGWTCTYSSTTFKFTISNTGSVSLRLSVSTNAIWDTIGFTTTSDLTDTSFTADQIRVHTSESIVWDLGASSEITFFAIVGKINETFNFSSSATLKLYANSLDDWSAPPLDVTLTRSDYGIFHFLDNLDTSTYRWWKFEITDVGNTLGPNISMSHIYLGDYLTFTNRDVGHGYNKAMIDPSIVTVAESGAMYFDTKSKFASFSELKLDILERTDKDYLESLFYRTGKTIPFYCSIDPLSYYTTNIYELTKFVYFTSEPYFNHTFRDMFTTTLNVRENV